MTTRTRRRGMGSVLGLVLLGVVAVVGASAISQWRLTRLSVDGREARLQAEWLARSGAEAALAKLRSDADYKGETLSPLPGAEVTVRVTPEGERRRVAVAVRYAPPGQRPHAAELSRLVRRDGGKVVVERAE